MNTIDNLLLENEIKAAEADVKLLMQNVKKTLKEGVTDLGVTDLADKFDEAIKRLDAAKRGLGIVNKLPQGEERKANRSRIMGNLNRLRSLFNDILKQTQQEVGAVDPHNPSGWSRPDYKWAQGGNAAAKAAGWPDPNNAKRW